MAPPQGLLSREGPDRILKASSGSVSARSARSGRWLRCIPLGWLSARWCATSGESVGVPASLNDDTASDSRARSRSRTANPVRERSAILSISVARPTRAAQRHRMNPLRGCIPDRGSACGTLARGYCAASLARLIHSSIWSSMSSMPGRSRWHEYAGPRFDTLLPRGSASPSGNTTERTSGAPRLPRYCPAARPGHEFS